MSNFQDYDDKELDSLIAKAANSVNAPGMVLDGLGVDESSEEDAKKIKTLKRIKTVEQVVLSYEAAIVIRKIRGDLQREEVQKALGHLPKLDIPYAHEKTQELYKRFAKKIKMKPLFVYTAKAALEDMFRYGFEKNPSVMKTGMKDSENLISSFGASNVQKFQKISLLDHTLHVFEVALQKIDEFGRISGKEPAILAALLHDFGKSEGIHRDVLGDNVGKGYKAHQETSAIYIKTLLANKVKGIVGEENFSKDVFDIIAHTVERHHSKTTKDLKDSFIVFVQKTDMAARNEEMEQIMKGEV